MELDLDRWVANNMEAVREYFEREKRVFFTVNLIALKNPMTGEVASDPLYIPLCSTSGSPSSGLLTAAREVAQKSSAVASLVIGIATDGWRRNIVLALEHYTGNRVWSAAITGDKMGEFKEESKTWHGEGFCEILPTVN